MYDKFQGGGRPETGTENQRPFSSGSKEIPIQDIINFARSDSKETWDALGLQSVSLPEVSYGKTSEFLTDPDAPHSMIDEDGKKVTLNKKLRGVWQIAQFAQAVLMEMGNCKNIQEFMSIRANLKSYKTSDEYARAIESVEYGTFIIVCTDSYKPTSALKPSIWSGVPSTFEEYYTSPRMKQHVDNYRLEWENGKK